MRDLGTMHLVKNAGLPLNSKFSVEQAEPLNKSIVTSEGSETNIVVWWLEAKHLKRLLG